MKSAAVDNLDFRNTNTLWCSVLVETLVRCGLRQAVISPGSRSAPLTIALARHPAVEAVSVLDERSAGFFALGLAKQHRMPVALVCTSGTAAANFLPAVVEAHESGVPLLVLTADRPPELRDCSSGQTIDQVKLYGHYAVHHHEFAVPQATVSRLRYLRQTAIFAFGRALAPNPGPVHLNCPFRDPLVPVSDGIALPAPQELAEFFENVVPQSAAKAQASPPSLRFSARGVIVVGPTEQGGEMARQVGRLSRALGWPVLADALSPLRTHAREVGDLIAHYDTVLRHEGRAQELRPEQVICLGGWPTSKVLRGWLEQADPTVFLFAERLANLDGLHLRTRLLEGAWADLRPVRRAGRVGGGYLQAWRQLDARAGRALRAAVRDVTGMIEPIWPGVLASQLPVRTPCFIASSMPVRDAEYFWPAGNRGQRFHFNRGANGIDGTLSTALGVAFRGTPAVLVTGDLALLHDSNGLLLAPKFKGSLTVLLINNAGGGIFGHLPVAAFEPPFEEFFATPQTVDFSRLCSAHEVPHTMVKNVRHLGRLLQRLPARGIRVLELRTDRRRDAAWRKATFAQVAQGLA